jgi:hypothetical protein
MGSKSLTLLEYNQHLVVWINGRKVEDTCKIQRFIQRGIYCKIHFVVVNISAFQLLRSMVVV